MFLVIKLVISIEIEVMSLYSFSKVQMPTVNENTNAKRNGKYGKWVAV
jgi:hypothetical protein